ncbi:MAG: hypothetical protein M1548_08285 [Actinobacteria bacterium]|nr:hypothetical protein [Actinomycetota bacterium]
MTEKDLLEFVQEKAIINRTLRVATGHEVFTGTAQEIGWGVLILKIERLRPGIHPGEAAEPSYEQVAIDIGQIVSIAF